MAQVMAIVVPTSENVATQAIIAASAARQLSVLVHKSPRTERAAQTATRKARLALDLRSAIVVLNMAIVEKQMRIAERGVSQLLVSVLEA